MNSFFQLITENPFIQRALLAGIVIGFSSGFFSGFINLRKQSLSVSALSHTMLPGIAFAIWLTGSLTQINAFIGATFAALLVGVSSLLVARNSRIPQGTALAILYTASFAAGVAALPFLPVKTELEHWLFGDILTVSNSDLNIVFFVGLITLTFSNIFMRPLLLTLFEPNVAAAQGVPIRWMQYMSSILLVLMLVSSLQSVGCALSVGLLVAPAAIMLFYTNNTTALFWGGGIIGALASVAGILLSALYDQVSPGPTILILLGAVFILSFLFSPKYGLLSPRKKHSH